MMKFLLSGMCMIYALSVNCQAVPVKSTGFYDFEDIRHDLTEYWQAFGLESYVVSLDSTDSRSGKYSLAIEFTKGEVDFKAISFKLPGNYNGTQITLSGYMKTENVSEGFAGLWMRIDPRIAFDNMEARDIKGTTDWTKYEITLRMDPVKTTQIVVGALMAGKGKIWVDDLKVTIDGLDLTDVDTIIRKIYPADKDKEFDAGSLVNDIKLDEEKTERLKNLGLIWGFLKFYHPAIANGDHNWDYELFRILSKVLNANDNKQMERELISWINHLGTFTSSEEVVLPQSDVKFYPDMAWIEDLEFSNELTSLLQSVRNAVRPDENYYVGLSFVGNPVFKNEKPYALMKYPDTGYRILSLYRYWNMIQYYFPYKNLIEEDWKNVLAEFIPKFIEAQHESDYTMAVWELIGRVHDTHANIWGQNEIVRQYRGTYYAPVEVAFVESQAVVVDFLTRTGKDETGLQIGDVILEVNHETVEAFIQRRLKYTPASNYPTKLRDIAMDVLRTSDSLIQLTYIRDGVMHNTSIKAYTSFDLNKQRDLSTDTSFKLLTPDIAYINNGLIKKTELPVIWATMKSTKGLIIDNRNYPSDFVIYELSGYLMPERIPFVKFSKGSISNPGLFTLEPNFEAGQKFEDYYKGKVVILVNEKTQSSAEFHSMAYRVAPDAVVIGSTTAGADGNVSDIYLPGDIRTMISGIGIYYPDGRETQRIGIVPDIEVKPTVEGIRNGRDEVLEKAIEIVNAGK